MAIVDPKDVAEEVDRLLGEVDVDPDPEGTTPNRDVHRVLEAWAKERIRRRGEVRADRETPAEATSASRHGALVRAIRDALEAIQNLPSGIDWDADPNDPCPDDCSAHVGGLVAQILRDALAGAVTPTASERIRYALDDDGVDVEEFRAVLREIAVLNLGEER